MSNRVVEAILLLSAKLGNMAAFRQLSGNLDKVDRKAKAFNRSQSMIAASTGKAMMATARFLAPAALAYGIKNSVVAYAAVERRLNRIAINADKGRDSVDAMLKVVNRTSHDYAMSQDEVTTGLETLVAAGRSAEDAMAFLPSVTATAQAAGGEIADMATTADALGTSMGITASEMQHAFDILVTSGKQGKFELRDMARYLPSMAPAFAALGYKGEKGLSKLAAMLQTIRQRTGSAEEAATAAQNIFQKMESDQTVAKFKKFGIDLRREMSRARKEGRDLVDVFLDLSVKATKGDLSKIPQLFTDAQFQVGMRALLQGRQDMEGFQKALANVDGSTLHDLGQVLDDNQSKIDRMASSWEKLKLSFGNTVADSITSVADSVSGYLDYDQAITAGLKKRGLDESQQATWRARNWFSQHERGLAAFEGGWRSPEGRVAENGKMENSPELPSRRRDAVSSGGGGLPTAGPIPASRPDPRMALPDLVYNRFPPRSPEGARRAIDDDRRAATAKIIDGGSAGGLRSAMMGDGGEVSVAIKEGGEQAAQSISQAGMTIGDAGGQAGSAIETAAQAIARAGEQAAAAIRAAAADLMRPIGSLGNRPAGQLTSRNTGRSMAGAGSVMGPR